MKGEFLSSEQIVKNQESEYLKNSQNSSQPHLDYNKKASINFQGIQKNAFYQLIQKTKDFSRAILERLAIIEKKSRERLSLKGYLNIIQNKHFYIESNSIYNKAINEFKGLFLAQVECIWQQFNQQQRREYEQFGKQNYRIVKQFERELKVAEQKFNGLQMLKIDVLCLAFHFNSYYFTGLKNQRTLLPYDLLQKIFGYNKDYIAKMAQKFKRSEKDIKINYKQQFHQYYEFLYFIRLSYKFINYSKRNGKEALDNISLAYIQFNKNQQQAQYSSNGKFKFCQIAFQPILLKFKIEIKEESIEKLQKISNQLEIPLNFLLKIGKTSENSNKEQYLAKFQQNLYKCQWVFLKGTYSLIHGINAVFQNKIASSTFYWAKNRQRLLLILFRLAIERFNLLPNIFKMHQKLDPKILIYVHKFQYSLRETQEKNKEWFQNGNTKQQQVQDLKCCMVMLVANQQILSYSTCRNGLTLDCYISVVKLCLKQKVIQYTKSFNLVLYGFDFEKPIEWQSFIQFQIYMNKNYDSRIYMLNDPELFKPHFLIDAFIKCFLSQLSLNKRNFSEYFQVCVNKLLKEIDCFDKKTNEQYFEYFSKVMSLEFGIKDVWKCFKKERGNKYNALIFGGLDLEEVCPKDFPMLLKEEIPNQQWFFTIQQCSASYHIFREYQQKEKWRNIQSFENLSRKEFLDFLKRKHLKERQIKRILRDIARCLIDYQLLFKQLIDKRQGFNESADKNQIVSFLMTFYQSQNKNIDQVYSRSQREALINESAKKYDKQIPVNYFSKKGKKNVVVVKTQNIQ